MTDFEKDILEGLDKTPKQLPSKYFYDSRGDQLFVEITKLPEYYLTSAENEIIAKQREDILDSMDVKDRDVEVIELGAGDGHKAVSLLEPLRNHTGLTFVPVDISKNALETVKERFDRELPEIQIQQEQDEYFSAIRSLNGKKKKVVLFLGSNIGNLSEKQANNFMMELNESLAEGDKVLLGVDLKKSREVIMPAYNDQRGITREFNLNLLHRINRELDADFDLDAFEHQPEYDESKGEARSFLTSVKDQVVQVGKEEIAFSKGEKIQTEISQKYDRSKLERILRNTDLRLVKTFSDSRNYFADYLLEKSEGQSGA